MKSFEQMRIERVEQMIAWRLEQDRTSPHQQAEAEALEWLLSVVENCTCMETDDSFITRSGGRLVGEKCGDKATSNYIEPPF